MSSPPSLTAARLLVALTLLGALAPAAAAPEGPTFIGEHLYEVALETPHPYPGGSPGAPQLVWSDHYSYPDAKYLVFEFQQFDLAPGDWVEVRDPKRGQVHVYSGKGFRDQGGDFITKMILGSEAYIDLYSTTLNHEHYGYRIERITRGFSDHELAEQGFYPEAICGVPDQEDAICYETSFPDVYEGARAVVRIVMDGSALCTGWLVSCQNHLMTNNHCTWDDDDFDTQGELDRMEFQFMYQDATCGGGGPSVEYSFMSGTWLENDRNLDYTIIQAPAEEEPAATYGWLLIDDRLADIDEQMYIVGHPLGRPKEIALYSTETADQDNPDGFCEVFSTDQPVCIGGTVPEIGYFCDTEGGSSGSPVLSRDTNKVIALHHCANCPNRGVRIQNIWAMNQGGSNPLPACSLFDDVGSVGLDRGRYGCSDTVSVEVQDGSLQGAGSEVVTVWSDTEASPETVTLTETPADSGTFAGAFDTTGSAAASDGLLSVSDGDTITVRYIDADDGQGGSNIARDILAAADCAGPVISNVQATDVQGTSARILWDTDEPADSLVFHGTIPPTWSSESDPSLVISHDVTLGGLPECTDQFFWVESTDEAGNTTIADSGGSYYGFATGINVIPTFASVDTPVAINDLSSTLSTIAVTDGQTVLDVDVTVNISHTYDGDLDIYLEGPNGTEIELSTDNGGTGEDYVANIFDDEAPTTITAGTPPYTGSFGPEQALSIFDGLSSAGNWTLRVLDDALSDTGTLESWSLTLTFPVRACGPHAAYVSHALDGDLCTLGGPGDADGVWDAGEEIDFLMTVKNDGTDPLTAVQATISSLTPGVTVLHGAETYGALAAGAGAVASTPFAVHLSDQLACGATVSFQADIIAAEGGWSQTFSQTVGQPISGGGVAFSENFDTAGILPTWTVVDGGTTSDTWFADSAADPQGCANTNPGAPMGGNWAAVDSDCALAVDMDESLITPTIDLSSGLTASLEFDHFFNLYQTEVADADVRSTLTGGSWVTVKTWGADTANPEHEIIDITAEAAGVNDVQIRWHYYNANFEWYWYVDNVVVSFTSPGGCSMTSCSTGSPPGEQSGAAWPDLISLTWDPDSLATQGYRVYRGAAADLPALRSSTLDSCLRYSGPGVGDNIVDLSIDVPAAGGFYWYLITGANGVGEGDAGSGSDGLRILNGEGACAP